MTDTMEMCLICPKTFPIMDKDKIVKNHKIDWKESKGLCITLKLEYFRYRAYFLKCLFCEDCKMGIKNCTGKIKCHSRELTSDRKIFETNLAYAEKAQQFEPLTTFEENINTQLGYDPLFQRDIRKLVVNEISSRSNVKESEDDHLEWGSIQADLISFKERFSNMALELDMLTSRFNRSMPSNDLPPDHSKESSSQTGYPQRTIENVIITSNSDVEKNGAKSCNYLGPPVDNQPASVTSLNQNQIHLSHLLPDFPENNGGESQSTSGLGNHFSTNNIPKNTTSNIPSLAMPLEMSGGNQEVHLLNNSSGEEKSVPENEHQFPQSYSNEAPNSQIIVDDGHESDDDLDSLMDNQKSTIMNFLENDIDCASNFQSDFSELIPFDAENEPDPFQLLNPWTDLPKDQIYTDSSSGNCTDTSSSNEETFSDDNNSTTSNYSNKDKSEPCQFSSEANPSQLSNEISTENEFAKPFSADHDDEQYPCTTEIKYDPADFPEFSDSSTDCADNTWDTLVSVAEALTSVNRDMPPSEMHQSKHRNCKTKNSPSADNSDSDIAKIKIPSLPASTNEFRDEFTGRKRKIPAGYCKGIAQLFTPDPIVVMRKLPRIDNIRKENVVKNLAITGKEKVDKDQTNIGKENVGRCLTNNGNDKLGNGKTNIGKKNVATSLTNNGKDQLGNGKTIGKENVATNLPNNGKEKLWNGKTNIGKENVSVVLTDIGRERLWLGKGTTNIGKYKVAYKHMTNIGKVGLGNGKKNMGRESVVKGKRNIEHEKLKKCRMTIAKENQPKRRTETITQPVADPSRKTMHVHTNQKADPRRHEKFRKSKQGTRPEKGIPLAGAENDGNVIVREDHEYEDDMILKIENLNLILVKRGSLFIGGSQIKLSQQTLRYVQKLKFAVNRKPLSVRLHVQQLIPAAATKEDNNNIVGYSGSDTTSGIIKFQMEK